MLQSTFESVPDCLQPAKGFCRYQADKAVVYPEDPQLCLLTGFVSSQMNSGALQSKCEPKVLNLGFSWARRAPTGRCSSPAVWGPGFENREDSDTGPLGTGWFNAMRPWSPAAVLIYR